MADGFADETMERLMADPQLAELCELHKTGDSIFDVVGLTETQNSAMLAWMLDPKEGHGQGDEILRDLLTKASATVGQGVTGLDGRGATARFFSEWTPSRIRTSTFASAFTTTELRVSEGERIDLCVVDTQNGFVIVVENKAGAKHTDAQLERYRDKVSSTLKANPRLRDLDQVFIALDFHHDPDDERPRPSGMYWLHMGYEWLETSATRAQAHVDRGNASARLVATYCKLQTEWESPGDERIRQLAASLHQAHPEAIDELLSYSGKGAATDWLTRKDGNWTSILFGQQNKSVVQSLRTMRGMASVATAIKNIIPGLPAGNVYVRRRSLELCPRGAEAFTHDGVWPVYLRVRYAGREGNKFNVAACWDGLYAKTPEVAGVLRAALAKDDKRFATHIRALHRHVPVARDLSYSELLDMLPATEARLSGVLRDR